MSFATIAGIPIRSGRLTFRLQGAWDGELAVQTEDASAVTGAVDVVIGSTTLKGTSSIAAADRGDAVTVRVTGGKGGLSAAVTPQGYNQPTRRQVLQDALAAGGEGLAGSADGAVLDAQLPAWVRLAGTVGDAVWSLVELAGATWRVLPDGAIWVGTDAWTVVPEDGIDVEREDPTNQALEVALEDLLVLPGSTFAGQKISGATYKLDDSSLRARLEYGGQRGQIEELLGGFVQSETKHRDFEAKYAAKAVSQNADGSLELRPYDARLPGLSKVPVKLGIPGVTKYTITSGIDCILEFENGSPAGQVVTAFAASGAQALSFDAAMIKLGSDNASDRVVTEQRLIQAFASHTHPVPALGTSGAPTAPLSNVGSPKVMAD
jgi:hypothetical protein